MSATIIGIPARGEQDWLPDTLKALAKQSDTDFSVWVGINQGMPSNERDYAATWAENQHTIEWLTSHEHAFPFSLHVHDARGLETSVPPRKRGVGWARHILVNAIIEHYSPDATYISLDADTLLSSHYVAEVKRAFRRHPKATGLTASYRHPLPPDTQRARHLLRYEAYMRCYHLSLWRIGSPYAFTALGSALAFPLAAYRRTHGFPLKQAGEDFYLLQQLRKIGPLIHLWQAQAYPAARVSQRVAFGTGPILAEDSLDLQQTRFPFYEQCHFDRLAETYALLPALYERDLSLPITDFLTSLRGGGMPFQAFRRQAPDPAHFVRACHEYLDGLRTLQCVRFYQSQARGDRTLAWNPLLDQLGIPPFNTPMSEASIESLDQLRDQLLEKEQAFQQAFMDRLQRDEPW